MNRKWRSRALVAGMPTAAFSAAGVAGAAGAFAATSPHAYSRDIAGYQTARWPRFFMITVTLPTNNQCAQVFSQRSPAGAGAAITLGPAEESNAGVPLSRGDASTVGVSFVPSASGCGLISPSFASNVPGYTCAGQFGAGAITLHSGDSVTLSLYYSQGSQFTSAQVIDNTTGKGAHTSLDGTATYKGGSATAGFGPYHPIAVKTKLWAMKNTRLTTYTGQAGALGAFGPQAVVMTNDGTAAGTTYADEGSLWNRGQNFSVFAH